MGAISVGVVGAAGTNTPALGGVVKISSIGATGRVYATIDAWIASTPASGDIGELYDDAVFTDTPTLSLSTGTYTIRAAESERHDGTFGSGPRFIPGANTHTFSASGTATWNLEHFEVRGGNQTSNSVMVPSTAITLNLKRMLFEGGATTGSSSDGFELTGESVSGSLNADNCVFWKWRRSDIYTNASTSTWTVNTKNCTHYNTNTYNFRTKGTGNWTIEGGIHEAGSGVFSSDTDPGVLMNDSILGTGVPSASYDDTNNLLNQTFGDGGTANNCCFNDIANGDFHLRGNNVDTNVAYEHIPSARNLTDEDFELGIRPTGNSNSSGADEPTIIAVGVVGTAGTATPAVTVDAGGAGNQTVTVGVVGTASAKEDDGGIADIIVGSVTVSVGVVGSAGTATPAPTVAPVNTIVVPVVGAAGTDFLAPTIAAVTTIVVPVVGSAGTTFVVPTVRAPQTVSVGVVGSAGTATPTVTVSPVTTIAVGIVGAAGTHANDFPGVVRGPVTVAVGVAGSAGTNFVAPTVDAGAGLQTVAVGVVGAAGTGTPTVTVAPVNTISVAVVGSAGTIFVAPIVAPVNTIAVSVVGAAGTHANDFPGVVRGPVTVAVGVAGSAGTNFVAPTVDAGAGLQTVAVPVVGVAGTATPAINVAQTQTIAMGVVGAAGTNFVVPSVVAITTITMGVVGSASAVTVSPLVVLDITIALGVVGSASAVTVAPAVGGAGQAVTVPVVGVGRARTTIVLLEQIWFDQFICVVKPPVIYDVEEVKLPVIYDDPAPAVILPPV